MEGSVAPLQFIFANNYSDTSDIEHKIRVSKFISDKLEGFFWRSID